MLLAWMILHIMGVFSGFCICSPSFMEEIDILLLSFEGKRNWLTLQIAQYFAQIHDHKTSLLQIALCWIQRCRAQETGQNRKAHLGATWQVGEGQGETESPEITCISGTLKKRLIQRRQMDRTKT